LFRNSSRSGATALRQDLKAKLHRLLVEFRILRRVLVHPRVPWHAKAISGCAILYIVSPIQLIPNFIPVIGQMDDVLVVILALRYCRRCVPPSILEECENRSPVTVTVTTSVTSPSAAPTEQPLMTRATRIS
jgi:uncharacterized membrane protein YkvA (DUF1232 family)